MSYDNPLRQGRRFANPWPGIQKHGFRDLLKWTFGRQQRRRQLSDALRFFPRVRSSYLLPRAAPDVLTATWVGHTSVLLQFGGFNILTDPMWSSRASPLTFLGPKRFTEPGVSFDDLPMIDLVLLSHDHYDHLDASTVRRLAARFPAAAWRCPIGVAAFIRKQGGSDVEELSWYEATSLGDLQLSCVPAQHFSGRGFFSRDSTLWSGWVLSAGKRSVYFAGDTALNPSFTDIGARYGPFDLALMPIGAYDPKWFMGSVHMDPEDCIEAVRMLSPNSAEMPLLLATHWGTFKLTDEPLAEPPERMRAAWSGAGFAAERLWIAAFGETRTL